MAKAEPAENKLKEAMSTAKLVTHPGVNAAMVIKEFAEVLGGLDAVEVAALAVQLEFGMNDVRKNDLRQCEEMLYCQAHALQAIFVDLSRQASKQEWFPNVEPLMRLAMKAQSQCRTTVETLAAIKNPPVVVARQANIAQGPQQVNNGMMPAGEPRAGGETENTPNKLLEEKPHERLDFGTPRAAVGSDPAMATLGTFDGAEVRRR